MVAIVILIAIMRIVKVHNHRSEDQKILIEKAK
jgi:hypothetical protein